MSEIFLPDDPIAKRAVEWMVHLGSGDASPADADAFRQWCTQDPRHETAAARLESSLNLFDRLPAESRATSTRLLQSEPQSKQRRHLLTNALGLGLFAVGSGLVLDRYQPVLGLLCDASTGTAERRKVALPEGSELLLNARSSVNWAFNSQARQIHLREGELIARVAADAYRPFVVMTTEGAVHALGARFLVRQDEGSIFIDEDLREQCIF